MENNVLSDIRDELAREADVRTRDSARNFFKEKVTVYGVKTAAVARIAKKYWREVKPLGKSRVFELCEELFKSGYMEEAFIACEWAYSLREEYQPGDFAMFEHWVGEYVNNWATCDTLCNHTIGSFIEKYPRHIEDLKRWAKSENRWFRRAAAVTLIIPAKQGNFLVDIFAIADILLEDKDDLVQKGYGWLLKEASRQHQQEVLDYVVRNRKTMPRTALRYAIEKMPEESRRLAMAK